MQPTAAAGMNGPNRPMMVAEATVAPAIPPSTQPAAAPPRPPTRVPIVAPIAMVLVRRVQASFSRSYSDLNGALSSNGSATGLYTACARSNCGVNLAVRPDISAAMGNSTSSTRKRSGVPASTVPSGAFTLKVSSSTTSDPASVVMIDCASLACATKPTASVLFTGAAPDVPAATPVATVTNAAITASFLILMKTQ